jgi:uncharacterized damage-inducible protein DinB
MTTTRTRKDDLISAMRDERTRTRRILAAFPAAESELRPHETSQSARELAHTFCTEASIGLAALNDTLDMSKLGTMPQAPATWDAVLAAFDGAYDALFDALEQSDDDDLDETVDFMTGPKQVGPVAKHDILRLMLNDQIHHRGQLSVYLRMSGQKVPSIYGPSKDEPWT